MASKKSTANSFPFPLSSLFLSLSSQPKTHHREGTTSGSARTFGGSPVECFEAREREEVERLRFFSWTTTTTHVWQRSGLSDSFSLFPFSLAPSPSVCNSTAHLCRVVHDARDGEAQDEVGG